MQCHSDLDFTFDLAVVTLTYKILSGLYLKTERSRNLLLGRDIGWGLSWCDLDLAFS